MSFESAQDKQPACQYSAAVLEGLAPNADSKATRSFGMLARARSHGQPARNRNNRQVTG